MPAFDVEFEVWCSCGEGLCNQANTDTPFRRSGLHVTIEPCEKCLDNAKEEADSEGYGRGYKDRGEETATVEKETGEG